VTAWPDILICRCVHSGIVPADRSSAVADALREAGLPCVTVPDLCALCAKRDPNLLAWAGRPGRKIVACHPRAIVNLFDAAGATLPDDAQIVNLRTGTAAAAGAELGLRKTENGRRKAEDGAASADATSNIQHPTANPQPPAPGIHPPSSSHPPLSSLPTHHSSLITHHSSLIPHPSSLITHHSSLITHPSSLPPWLPWFPVIDRARCTNCRQCLEFCLFGVYVVENGRVDVRQPQNCKPHCPACARICPHAAIIFPKHDEAPIDGAPIVNEDAERARARHDLHELLGDDIDAALAERRRRAKSRLLDADKVRRAMEERARCSGGSGAAGGAS
jgi:Pyruvate/2-oxoacid:ferredoxin oxidoreductase delta subunit